MLFSQIIVDVNVPVSVSMFESVLHTILIVGFLFSIVDCLPFIHV